jgi:hypothetical protein
MSLPLDHIRSILGSLQIPSAMGPIFAFLQKAAPSGFLQWSAFRSKPWRREPEERQSRTGELCKQYLRLHHRNNLPLVEDFILEIEGSERDGDGSKWESFLDLRSITDEGLKPLDLEFARWLKT